MAVILSEVVIRAADDNAVEGPLAPWSSTRPMRDFPPRNSSTMRTPFQACDGACGHGVLRLRECFASRSIRLAEDDRRRKWATRWGTRCGARASSARTAKGSGAAGARAGGARRSGWKRSARAKANPTESRAAERSGRRRRSRARTRLPSKSRMRGTRPELRAVCRDGAPAAGFPGGGFRWS